MTSLEQSANTNLTKYRQYVVAQHRVSKWVEQLRPNAAAQQQQQQNKLHSYSTLKTRKRIHSRTNDGTHRESKTSHKSKDRQGHHHQHHHSGGGRNVYNSSRIDRAAPGKGASPISPEAIALVASTLIVWGLDLSEPPIIGLFGFGFLLNWVTIPRDEKGDGLCFLTSNGERFAKC